MATPRNMTPRAEKAMLSCGGEAPRVPIAQLVYDQFEKIAERAEILATRTEERLECVMNNTGICNPCEEKEKEQYYPSFFNGLRQHANKIEHALTVIEDCLSRTEL